MTQHYIGVKQVTAWPEEKDGKLGYAVMYEDGYTSWSPKETFERAYLPMGKDSDGTKVNPAMVKAMISELSGSKMGQQTAVIHGHLANGFEVTEMSACVEPANYDQSVGEGLARQKVENQVWMLLGFVLAWARKGIQN